MQSQGAASDPQALRQDIDQTRAEMSGTVSSVRGELLRGALSDLFSAMSRLGRQEVSLAKAEAADTAMRAGKDAAFLATAGVLGYTALLTVVAGVVELLATILPRWLSALLVGAGLAGGGAVLAKKGFEGIRQGDLVPQQTVESIKETGQQIKNQL